MIPIQHKFHGMDRLQDYLLINNSHSENESITTNVTFLKFYQPVQKLLFALDNHLQFLFQ